ncbi:histidine phosphatase family protein [Limnochorda pilosa]|uniref:Alpha-ribazole phosphatase n=1 Tax=Limnochorda pilosa TaxID=1555112 RepID=A0A0K2SKK2_LIMPI|nr:histidine phosphatase family protein [Limnochorda pilosa]BAS27547.1 alpha-ribazole phosphatase [Limnochorda pilosa]
MSVVYLVRHGETEWNRIMRIQGQSDVELSERGRDQARRLARRMERWRIDRALTSDLARAQETARIVLGEREVPLETDPRLRERHFGEWEGLTREEVLARDEAAYHRWGEDPWPFRPPGGESLEDVSQRAASLVEELRAGDGHVLVVSHGGTLQTMLRHLLGWAGGGGPQIILFNTGLTILRLWPDRVRLERLNDIGHLEIHPDGQVSQKQA